MASDVTQQQFDGMEDNYPPELVSAAEEWLKAKSAKTKADKRMKKAVETFVDRFEEAGLPAIREPGGTRIIEPGEGRKTIKIRKAERHELPQSDETALDKG